MIQIIHILNEDKSSKLIKQKIQKGGEEKNNRRPLSQTPSLLRRQTLNENLCKFSSFYDAFAVRHKSFTTP